jgi:hypothetical protein
MHPESYCLSAFACRLCGFEDSISAAQREAAATQLAILEATATAEVARLRTTVDYVSTRAALAATRGAFLELTLIARGTPESVIREFQSMTMASLVTLTPHPCAADGRPGRWAA